MMKSYLLDTNVISELMTNSPNQNVIQFLAQIEESYLSVITLHELHYGLNLLPEGQRKKTLAVQLEMLLMEYGDYIIPLTPVETTQAAILRATAKQQGYIVHLADALIASTAKVHNLVIATRNTKDFAQLGIELINPWDFDS
ncbi:MAG: type II toxin-antitoxin system VapC family toxin [Methylococcales bacterium]